MAEQWWFSSLEVVDREERCWHTTFRGLRVNAKSSPKKVGIEGLRILKPHIQKGNPPSMLIADGDKENSNTTEGVGLEVRLILCEDNTDDIVNWEVEDIKFTVKQPIEAAVTKDELQHLTLLCKSEIDSIGRITAGVLRLLKLEGSVGQAVIDQLGNLGSEGIDKIFSSEKVTRDGSVVGNRGHSPLPSGVNEGPHKTMEETLTQLEEVVVESQAKLSELITHVGTSEFGLFFHSAPYHCQTKSKD
ncbi:uncharacterized protein DS421_15g508350 [Arachis hypogaea]|nr:uncharacterized protein DS421_15g508350 [Arachis hypogaea]